ncbi:MAG: hypothetical protein LC730_00455 [Acidobacteria bacterium]|nr:hypothetical protein [Acidobacteriota bacterium]
MLIGLATIVPFGTNEAEAGPKKSKRYKKQKKYKKYSKRWWRQYHARQRRKRALRARRRALRLRQLRLAKKSENGKQKSVAAAAKPKAAETRSALLPSGQVAPARWKAGENSGAEVRFRLEDSRGSQVGTAAISVVGPTMGETVATGRNRSLGGVPTTALRREVINQMIRENGWVVNDFQKEVGGKSVYVVVAQSQNPGGNVQSRMFYFTEAEGRIYSVATNTAADVAEQLAEESEKVIFSLQARPRPVQQAAAKQE